MNYEYVCKNCNNKFHIKLKMGDLIVFVVAIFLTFVGVIGTALDKDLKK